jgi:ABC-2 type transport system ATP-binding protein
VPKSSLFGFLGPNGAGKSTTVSVLCTLRKPNAGNVEVAGFDVARDAHEVRKRIGVMFQEPSLDDRLTGRENLRIHALVWGVSPSVRTARIELAVERSGLGAAIDRSVRTYSGGMRRRLELARVLLHEPEVLFLDEPTVGLDPQTRRAFWSELTALRKAHGITVFLTTHYLEEVEQADSVAILDHGRVIAHGTPRELKARLPEDAKFRDLEEVFVHLTGEGVREQFASGSDNSRQAVSKRTGKR